MVFEYGEKEIAYLSGRDKRLAGAIEQIGPIERAVDPCLYSSIVHHIVGQQISTAAQATIWRRMREGIGDITPQSVSLIPPAQLQGYGITHKKAGYIASLTDRVLEGSLDLNALPEKDDAQIIKELSALDGIGVWTAEMLLIFCLQRPDVLSYGDLGIQRGLRKLYRHRTITKSLFERYKKRYSPYGTVAGLYLWAISSGAIPGLDDPMPAKPKTAKAAVAKGDTE